MWQNHRVADPVGGAKVSTQSVSHRVDVADLQGLGREQLGDSCGRAQDPQQRTVHQSRIVHNASGGAGLRPCMVRPEG